MKTRKELLVELVAAQNCNPIFFQQGEENATDMVQWASDQLAEIEKACGEEPVQPLDVAVSQWSTDEMRRAIMNERERCAKIAEDFERHDDDQCASIHRDIAARIQAGGQ